MAWTHEGNSLGAMVSAFAAGVEVDSDDGASTALESQSGISVNNESSEPVSG
jgi:hypothetical protein